MMRRPYPLLLSRKVMAGTLCILALCAATACKEKRKEEYLPPGKMTAVLLDMSLAESYSAMVKDTLHKPGIKNPDSLGVYYKAIFDHHRITKETFERSLAWYKKSPVQMDSIFTAILPIVTRWQDSANKH